MEAKAAVRLLLDQLPDDCTLEDVESHLHVLQQIERGRGDAAAGRTIPHEQVARELRRKWLHAADE